MVRPTHASSNADVGATYAADADSDCRSDTIMKSDGSVSKKKKLRTYMSTKRKVRRDYMPPQYVQLKAAV